MRLHWLRRSPRLAVCAMRSHGRQHRLRRRMGTRTVCGRRRLYRKPSGTPRPAGGPQRLRQAHRQALRVQRRQAEKNGMFATTLNRMPTSYACDACSGEGLLQRCLSWRRAEKLEGRLCVNRRGHDKRPRIEGTHSLGLREIQAKRKNNSGHVQPAALLLLLAGATLARRVWPELDRVLLSGDIEA